MAATTYDRRQQDLGNIILLEHVNVRVPDQQAATLFYIAGLGLTRDPYLMVSVDNMWANAGQTQFHLPTAKPQVLQGHVELVVPDLDALTRRLSSVREALAGTQFAFEVRDKHVAVTCPWGNQFRCVGPGPEWGDMTLGIGRVEVPVARGAAAGIQRPYAPPSACTIRGRRPVLPLPASWTSAAISRSGSLAPPATSASWTARPCRWSAGCIDRKSARCSGVARGSRARISASVTRAPAYANVRRIMAAHQRGPAGKAIRPRAAGTRAAARAR